MKKLTCTQCGANVNPETLTCDYCGSVFLHSEETVKAKSKKHDPYAHIFVRDVSNDELVTMLKETCSADNKQNVVGIIFMLFWTICAFGMFLSVVPVFGAVGIMPLLFAIFGVVILIGMIRPLFININYELDLVRRGEFEKAYNSFDERNKKSPDRDFVAGKIIVGFYKLKKFDEVKNMIMTLSRNDLSYLVLKNSVILEIAHELGIKTPNIVNVSSNLINM